MRLFGKITGQVNRWDRAEWLTPPFDARIGWPPEIYAATLRITQAVVAGVLTMADTVAVTLGCAQVVSETLGIAQELAVELTVAQDVNEDLALCQVKAVELER